MDSGKKEDNKKLSLCLRTIYGVTLRDRVCNIKIKRDRKIVQSIIDIVKKKGLKWFGHVNRLPDSSYIKTIYKKDFTKPHPRDRPPKRWVDQHQKDSGLPLYTAEKIAKASGQWRSCAYKLVAKLSSGYAHKSSQVKLKKKFPAQHLK